MSKLENKEKLLKAVREKQQLAYKTKCIRITSEISAQTLEVKKTQSNITVNQEHHMQQK
jgi:hypothetical protein